MMRVLLLALLFAGLPGSASPSPSADAPTEQALGVGAGTVAVCPVTPEEPVDPAIHVDHEGETIYFCCQRCRRQFLDDPDAYVSGVSTALAASGEDAHGHDHEHDHAAETPSVPARLLALAGRYHPVLVHFPIALLISGLIAEILGAFDRIRWFRDASRVLVLLGASGALVAAAAGWAAGLGASYRGEAARLLEVHRWSGTTTALLALVTLVASERYRVRPSTGRRISYLVALVLTAAVVGASGYLGGSLVYGIEHFTW